MKILKVFEGTVYEAKILQSAMKPGSHLTSDIFPLFTIANEYEPVSKIVMNVICEGC